MSPKGRSAKLEARSVPWFSTISFVSRMFSSVRFVLNAFRSVAIRILRYCIEIKAARLAIRTVLIRMFNVFLGGIPLGNVFRRYATYEKKKSINRVRRLTTENQRI